MINSGISNNYVIKQNGLLIQTCYSFLEPLVCFQTRDDITQLNCNVIAGVFPLDTGAMCLKL